MPRVIAGIALSFTLLTTQPSAALAQPKSDAELAAWVSQRVKDWQPTADERRFDDVGWAADIRTALRLANEHQRPVFLFTHDGHMDIGRC